MNTERLLRLADHLEQVVAKAPERFDLDFWSRPTDCGTVCCAVGHACDIPEFQEAGLRLEKHDDWGVHPVFLGSAGFRAAQDFFGICDEDADYLFLRHHYPWNRATPQMVAARIRDFVKREAA